MCTWLVGTPSPDGGAVRFHGFNCVVGGFPNLGANDSLASANSAFSPVVGRVPAVGGGETCVSDSGSASLTVSPRPHTETSLLIPHLFHFLVNKSASGQGSSI